MMNYIWIKLLVAAILIAVLVILKRKGIIKGRSKEEKLKDKKEKEEAQRIQDEKEKTSSYWIDEAFQDFIHWGTPILILTLFYIGAVDSKYGLNLRDSLSGNFTQNMNHAVSLVNDKVILKLYDIGFANHNVWFYIWWFTIIIWVYSVGYNMYKGISIKLKNQKGGKK